MRGKLEQYLAKQVNFPSSQSWFLEIVCSSQQTLCGNLEYGFLNCTGRLNNGALLLWPNNLASRWKGKSLPLSQLLALKHWRSKQVLGRKESQCVAKCFETKSSPVEDVDGRKKPDRKRGKKISLNIWYEERTQLAILLLGDQAIVVFVFLQFLWPFRVKSHLSRKSEQSLPLPFSVGANWRAAWLPCWLLLINATSSEKKVTACFSCNSRALFWMQ